MSTMYYEIQLSRYTDHISGDGHELTKLPIPFFADTEGMVGRQDYWNGKPKRIVGFAKDLSTQSVDLHWSTAMKEESTEQAVGMYLVTMDEDGGISGHLPAVDKIVRHERAE